MGSVGASKSTSKSSIVNNNMSPDERALREEYTVSKIRTYDFRGSVRYIATLRDSDGDIVTEFRGLSKDAVQRDIENFWKTGDFSVLSTARKRRLRETGSDLDDDLPFI